MPLDIAKYLHDIAVACDRLVQFTVGKDFVEFQQDALLRAAVERQFITIGEALGQAVKIDAALGASITHARQVIGFRSILVHGYSAIQDATVWGVIENDLATLPAEVHGLLVGMPDVPPVPGDELT